MNSGTEGVDTTKSIVLSLWLHERVNEKVLPGELRIGIGVALLQHSWDLADGSIVLIDENLPGVALTLARPMFEAYVRGIWALYCATDTELSEIDQPRGPLSWRLSRFVNRIKRAKLDQLEWINRILKEITELNELTYGGVLHLEGRLGDASIKPDYALHQQIWLVEEGIEIRIRVACELFDITSDSQAIEELNLCLQELNLGRAPL